MPLEVAQRTYANQARRRDLLARLCQLPARVCNGLETPERIWISAERTEGLSAMVPTDPKDLRLVPNSFEAPESRNE